MSAYLLAHFAKSQLWHASTLLFGFFLTEACGLDARTMSFIMAGSLVVNGVADAVVGTGWSDSDTIAASTIRCQAIAAPVTCLFFLLFCATPLLDPTVRVAWSMTALMGFRLAYPFIDVPQNAMVVSIARKQVARRALLAKRNMVSGLAGLGVAVLAAPLLIHERSMVAWLGWAGGLSVLVCFTALLLRAFEAEPAREPAASDTHERSSIPVLVTLAVMMVACSTFRALEPYYGAFAGKGTGLLVWAAIGGLLGQPLWIVGARRLGEGGILTVAAALLMLATIVLLGPWRAGPVSAATVGLCFGAGASGLWLILWSAMMARAAAGQATGHVGIFTCVSKLAQGVAMLLLGQVLATSPYRTALADPWSAPSLLMVAALVAIALACLMLIPALRVSRTAFGERPATRRPAARPDRG
ncbi:conserved membrane hypothetical protein [Sphingomonas sp. 8AM]|nr:conserved membrane hypothetical protein [Sphingomonas sp. 8AM]